MLLFNGGNHRYRKSLFARWIALRRWMIKKYFKIKKYPKQAMN